MENTFVHINRPQKGRKKEYLHCIPCLAYLDIHVVEEGAHEGEAAHGDGERGHQQGRHQAGYVLFWDLSPGAGREVLVRRGAAKVQIPVLVLGGLGHDGVVVGARHPTVIEQEDQGRDSVAQVKSTQNSRCEDGVAEHVVVNRKLI